MNENNEVRVPHVFQKKTFRAKEKTSTKIQKSHRISPNLNFKEMLPFQQFLAEYHDLSLGFTNYSFFTLLPVFFTPRKAVN